MKQYLQLSILALCATFLLSSCFTINNFQSARTLEKNQTELGFGLSAGSSFNIDADPDDTIGGFDNIGIPLVDFSFFGRYGVSDKVDIGFRLSALGDLGADVKFMAIGDRNSTFNLSPGLGLSTNAWLLGNVGIFQLEVPIHTSIQLADNFALIISPRYVGQSATSIVFEDEGWISYVGGTAGFEFGKKTKFSLGFNYLRPLGLGFNFSNYNIGAGVRFRF